MRDLVHDKLNEIAPNELDLVLGGSVLGGLVVWAATHTSDEHVGNVLASVLEHGPKNGELRGLIYSGFLAGALGLVSLLVATWLVRNIVTKVLRYCFILEAARRELLHCKHEHEKPPTRCCP